MKVVTSNKDVRSILLIHLILQMDWKIAIATIFLILAMCTSPGLSRSTGAPVEACSTLMPQHGANSNRTDPVPYELNVDMFEDPGVPNPDGSSRHTHSYTPGSIYSSKCFNLILS